MFWFFAATHASHYYLTITMQNYLRFPLQMCGVLRLLRRRWGYQQGEPPSPTSKIHYDQYNVQHFMPFRIAVMLPTHQRILSDVRFLPKDPPKKNSFFRAAIKKKKLIILYSSTVNPIRLHTVINFTFLNFSSIVDASLDNSNLINYIWSESIHELQVCLRRIT